MPRCASDRLSHARQGRSTSTGTCRGREIDRGGAAVLVQMSRDALERRPGTLARDRGRVFRGERGRELQRSRVARDATTYVRDEMAPVGATNSRNESIYFTPHGTEYDL